MIPFLKYQGAGNDFVIVDLRQQDNLDIQDPAVAAAVCDRQFGVGGDGVLVILPPRTIEAIATMRVLNADGSEAEMCGNGIRCVAAYLVQFGGAALGTLTIDTGAGALSCDVSQDASGLFQVAVDMGRPRLTRAEIPMMGAADARCVDQPIDLDPLPAPLRTRAAALRMTAVSMGNPHAIQVVSSVQEAHALATTLGPVLEHHPAFPRRTNVEFVAVESRSHLRLVVWERGSGLTLACGTGACATVVAACLLDLCDLDHDVRVDLPGGTLRIRVAPAYRTVIMTGPATLVFRGELAPLALRRRPS